ncbi:hypothetical protein LCGC14_3002540, partial [marine sediment metagenome]
GAAAVSSSFKVTVVDDQQPTLDIADVSMAHNEQVHEITLPVTDVNGQIVEYTALAIQPDGPAYELKTRLGLTNYLPWYDNTSWRGEKWMQSDAGLYYYILPTGQIFQYFGGQVGQVDTSYYADPQSFIDAGPAEIPGLAQFVSMDGNVLTISPDISFVGSFNVQVTATDSVTAPVVDTFSVTVNNLGPVWGLLSNDLQVLHNDPCVVLLSAIDPAGDDITYSFAVNTPGAEAYALRTELDLAIYLPLYDNHGGLGQKWMQSDAGLYYYILPSGQVFQYGGGLVGQVDPSYNANPQSLIDQVPLASPDVTFTYIYSTSQLTVNIPVDFVGTFEVIATVSDGAAAVSSSFKVTVVDDQQPTLDIADV